jgi:hypothetical protein
MYTQVVGKLRLALCPFEPQWGNVPLHLTARGLSTTPVPLEGRSFDAELDLVDHGLTVRTSDGGTTRRPLGGPVADFYRGLMDDLATLGLEPAISVLPSEVPDPIPFPDDRVHHTYDPEYANRFWRVLSRIDPIFKEHRARFGGRTSLVHFFWGTFDLALTRYSGARASPSPNADLIRRLAGNVEQIAGGWWPGDERHPLPAFYAYAYPEPPGIERAPIRPSTAAWSAAAGEFLLPYSDVRAAADPRAAILDFLDSTYRAGATLLGWSEELTRVEGPTDGKPAPANRARGR